MYRGRFRRACRSARLRAKKSATVFRFLLADCPVLYVSVAALLTLFFARADAGGQRTSRCSRRCCPARRLCRCARCSAFRTARFAASASRGSCSRSSARCAGRQGRSRARGAFLLFVAQRGAAAPCSCPPFQVRALPVRELSAHACRGLQPASPKAASSRTLPSRSARDFARRCSSFTPSPTSRCAARCCARRCCAAALRSASPPAAIPPGFVGAEHTEDGYAYFYITPGDLSIEFETR